MRLLEVRTVNPVFDDSSTPHTYLHEKNGFTLSLEQGIVSVGHKSMTGGRIVPFAACTATPAPMLKAAK